MDGLKFFFEEAESGFVPRVDAGIFSAAKQLLSSPLLLPSMKLARAQQIPWPAVAASCRTERMTRMSVRTMVLARSSATQNDMAPEDMTNAAMRGDGDAEGVVVICQHLQGLLLDSAYQGWQIVRGEACR